MVIRMLNCSAAGGGAAPAPAASICKSTTQDGCQTITAPTDADVTKSQSFEVPADAKWVQCGIDGRQNIRLKVQAADRIWTGLVLPATAEACNANYPAPCKTLTGAVCDNAAVCELFYPGELSGREKCVLVMNSHQEGAVSVTSDLLLESPGNWGAIGFGVSIVSLALAVVVGAGCYADIQRMNASMHKKKRQPGSVGHNRGTTHTAPAANGGTSSAEVHQM
eukprot:jgi/Chrzof1/3703/Cz13g05220.t1